MPNKVATIKNAIKENKIFQSNFLRAKAKRSLKEDAKEFVNVIFKLQICKRRLRNAVSLANDKVRTEL